MFVNSEPTDIQALTLHAGAVAFVIDLYGDTRHLSKREESCNALAAAAKMVTRIDGMTFSGAANALHASINRGHIGVLRAGLGEEFHEWRSPQVADRARLMGTCRYAPSQTAEGCFEDIRKMLDALVLEYPGLRHEIRRADAKANMPSMGPFEVPRDARIVQAVNRAFEAVQGYPQPTGAIHPAAFFGTDAAHLARAGIQGVVCGPGGEFNSMPDERVRKRQFLECVALYIHVICEICTLDSIDGATA